MIKKMEKFYKPNTWRLKLRYRPVYRPLTATFQRRAESHFAKWDLSRKFRPSEISQTAPNEPPTITTTLLPTNRPSYPQSEIILPNSKRMSSVWLCKVIGLAEIIPLLVVWTTSTTRITSPKCLIYSTMAKFRSKVFSLRLSNSRLSSWVRVSIYKVKKAQEIPKSKRVLKGSKLSRQVWVPQNSNLFLEQLRKIERIFPLSKINLSHKLSTRSTNHLNRLQKNFKDPNLRIRLQKIIRGSADTKYPHNLKIFRKSSLRKLMAKINHSNNMRFAKKRTTIQI